MTVFAIGDHVERRINPSFHGSTKRLNGDRGIVIGISGIGNTTALHIDWEVSRQGYDKPSQHWHACHFIKVASAFDPTAEWFN